MSSIGPLPFFGRSGPMERLLRALGPTGIGVALVVGDAGIGKTRLVREFLARDADQSGSRSMVRSTVRSMVSPTVVWCAADQLDGDRPFAAVQQLLDMIIEPGDAPSSGSLSRIDQLVDQLAWSDGQRNGPALVIVVDDVQWADPSSWRIVRRVARIAEESTRTGQRGPKLIVVARSPMSSAVAGQLDAALGPNAEQIVLEGLDLDAVGRFAEAASWSPIVLDGGRAQLLLDRTGGNPLLLEELLRATPAGLPNGALSHAGPISSPERPGPQMPASLRAAVLTRMVGLEARHRALLRYAALLGTRFSVTDLAHVSAKSVVEVVETLEAALEVGVIVADGTDLRFRHDLVADCFRDDQPAAVRQACHRHIAETLAARGAPSTRVAEHYVLASAAVDDDPSRAEAANWLERAAREIRPQALPSAITLLERSVALSPDDRSRQRRRVEMATLMLLAGRLEAAESECRNVLPVDEQEAPDVEGEVGATALIDPDLAIHVHGLLAVIASLRGPLHATQARARYQRVLTLVAHRLGEPIDAARRSELLDLRAETLAGQAIITVYTGDLEAAATLAHDALEAAEVGASRSAFSRAHETLALVAMARSDALQARHHAGRAVAWFAPDASPWSMVVTPHVTAALVAVSSGDMHGAVERCLDGLRITEQSDHLLPRLYLLPCLAVFRLIQGDLDEAVRLATMTNNLVDEWCPMHPTPVTRALVAFVAQLRGDPAATALADAAAAELGASGAQLAIADLAAWMVAMVWEQVGRVADARGLMRLIWDLIGAATGALVMAPDLVRTHMVPDSEFAALVVNTLSERATRAPGDRTELVRRRAKAILNHDVTELTAIAVRYDEIGSPLTGAYCRFDAARAASDGRVSTSGFEAALRAAIAAFDRLDAPAVTAELRALGRAGGVALRPTRAKRTNDLTQTERRVAELAGQGRSNREIGTALYMSGRTAEAHLGRVFAKLGVKNRVELAALLNR